jgi:hypothetical protein
MKHELFHLYLQIYVGKSYPKWFSEGMACYFAGQKKYSPGRDAMLRIFDQRVNLNPYVVGYAWIEFLVKKFGKTKLIKFTKFLKGIKYSRRIFNDHFSASYGFGFNKKELIDFLQ